MLITDFGTHSRVWHYDVQYWQGENCVNLYWTVLDVGDAVQHVVTRGQSNPSVACALLPCAASSSMHWFFCCWTICTVENSLHCYNLHYRSIHLVFCKQVCTWLPLGIYVSPLGVVGVFRRDGSCRNHLDYDRCRHGRVTILVALLHSWFNKQIVPSSLFRAIVWCYYWLKTV